MITSTSDKTRIFRDALLAAAFLFTNIAAQATPYAIYLSPNNGVELAPASGAANIGNNILATSWVFDTATPTPGYAGQPMWANAVRVLNTSGVDITFSLFSGVWDATGPNGGPGNRLEWGVTIPLTIGPGSVAIETYSNFNIPIGTFWMGYAFSNYGAPSTTSADLNLLEFVRSNGPTVGSDVGGVLLGTDAFALNNPSTGSLQPYHLGHAIEMYSADAPEPASVALLGLGFVGIGAIRRLRLVQR